MDLGPFNQQRLREQYDSFGSVRQGVETKLNGQTVNACVSGLRFEKRLEGGFSLEGDGTVRVRKSEYPDRPEPDQWFEYGSSKWQLADVTDVGCGEEWKFTLRRVN